jgi:TRAP-type transport system periplasmic protein
LLEKKSEYFRGARNVAGVELDVRVAGAIKKVRKERKSMKKAALLLAIVMGLTILAGVSFAAEKSYTWKIAHIRPQDSAIDKDLKRFADEMKAATNGRITVNIYGANQLGDYTVVQEKIGLGSVEMGTMSMSSGVDKRGMAFSMPYLVSDYTMAKKNYAYDTPFGNYIAKIYEKQNIKVLGYWPVYFGGIGLLKTPADPTNPNGKQNLKVRVPTMKSWEALGNGLGYQATPLPFSEFFTAAQTGMVDGILGGGAENYYVTFRDLIKFYIAANTHFECWPMTINLDLYNSLSPKDRKTLDEKAREMEARRWVKVEEEQDAYVALLAKAGVKVIKLTPEQQQAFAKRGREVAWPEMEKIFGSKVFSEISATFVLK